MLSTAEYIASLTLCILLFCSPLLAVNDCFLKIFEDDNMIDSKLLCINEFVSRECLPFVQTFNKSDLPVVFQYSDEPVEKPSSIDLVGLVNDYYPSGQSVPYKIPGVRVKWESPIAEFSRQNLNGYLLVFETKTMTGCRLFYFNTSSPYLLKKMQFSYDIQSLAAGNEYKINVYSMPLLQGVSRNDECCHVEMTITPFVQYKLNETAPALWSPSISIRTVKTGNIDVKFTLSPAEYNIREFEILLLKQSFSTNNYYRIINYDGNLYSSAEPEGKVQFDNLFSDSYQIMVRPIDSFSNLAEQCLCWKRIEFSLCPNERCCDTCTSVTSQWFQLNVTVMDTEIMSGTSNANTNVTTPDKGNITAFNTHFMTAALWSTGEVNPSTQKNLVPPVDTLTTLEFVIIICVIVISVLFLVTLVFIALRRKYNRSSAVIIFKTLPGEYKTKNSFTPLPDDNYEKSPDQDFKVKVIT